MTAKRTIKSHKGGRTAQLHVLVEPWVKEWIQAQGVSIGDWMTKHAETEREKSARAENSSIVTKTEKPL